MKQTAGTKSRLGFVTLLLLAAVALPLLSCNNSGMSADMKNSIEQAVDAAMTNYGIPGALVGVWSPKSGDLVLMKGMADIGKNAAMQRNDRVRICSITKTFTVTVVLELVDAGRLSLGDTLDRFYPDFPGADKITIRQLCNMTAGIADYSDDETFWETFTQDPNKEWTPDELVALAKAQDPSFAPGTGWKYSNTNAIILSMIVRQLTGNDIGAEIQTRIADVLKLENTYYPEGTAIEGAHAHGYLAGDNGSLVDGTSLYNPSAIGASGALIANLDDLKVWAAALADGDLLTTATQAERVTLVPGSYDYFGVPVQYGLGILSCHGFLGHPGDGMGYTNAAFHNPTTGTTIVVLLNKAPNADGFMALTLFVELAKIMNAADGE